MTHSLVPDSERNGKRYILKSLPFLQATQSISIADHSDTPAIFRMFLLFDHLHMKTEVVHCARFPSSFAVSPFQNPAILDLKELLYATTG